MGYTAILCEGDSDAILLSYYLGKTKGWTSIEKSPIGRKRLSTLPDLSKNVTGSKGYWYVKDGSLLYIWAIGGKDFTPALTSILQYNKFSQESIFSTLCIITDHDDSKCEKIIRESLFDACSEYDIEFSEPLSCNKWIISKPIAYPLDPEMQSISFFLTIMPDKEEGTLETFLLSCLALKDKTDEKVINQVKEFIDSIDCLCHDNDGTAYAKYLKKRGEKPKAKFAVFFSVVNPRKVFYTGNELLLSIPWENYDSINEYFALLTTKL